MTEYPEALLARELEICYANVSLITDYDVGVEGVAPVTHDDVIRVFDRNNENLRRLLFEVIPALPDERDCVCATALEHARFEACRDGRERSSSRSSCASRPRTTRSSSASAFARRFRWSSGREHLEEFRVRVDAPRSAEEAPRRVTSREIARGVTSVHGAPERRAASVSPCRSCGVGRAGRRCSRSSRSLRGAWRSRSSTGTPIVWRRSGR